MSNSTFHNTGSFPGATLLQDVQIGSVGQIGGGVVIGAAERDALRRVVAELLAVLPAGQGPELREAAVALVEEANKPQPKAVVVRSLGGTLTDATRTLGTAAAVALPLAEKAAGLAEKVVKLLG